MSNTNPRKQVRPQRNVPTHAAGFLLIEALFASMILGSGVVALTMLMGSATAANAASNRLSQAVLLADQARSLTDSTAFDQLSSTYDGQTLSALDTNGNSIAALQGYQQSISVTAVKPDSLEAYGGADPTAYLLTVDIIYNSEKLTTLTWLRTN